MIPHIGWTVPLVIALICTAAIDSAFSAQASRIEFTNGTAYEDVDFMVDDTFEIITFYTNDWKRTISFANVRAIYDRDGNDVTARYSGRYSETRNGYEPASYNQRPFGFGIGLGGNYSHPTSDYYTGRDPGIGYGGDIIISVTRKIALRGTLSKSGMNSEISFHTTADKILIRDDLKLNTWRYFLSAQYCRWPGRLSGGMYLPYLYTGMGLVRHSFSGAHVTQDLGGGEYHTTTFEPVNKFALTIGVGLFAMFSSSIGLEWGGTLDMVFVEGNYCDFPLGGTDAPFAYIWDLRLGLVALL